MEDITKKLLPIGSIVQLASEERKVMICGRQQIDTEEKITYDYLGCIYPKGIDQEDALLFNADSIVLVYFLGYRDLDEMHQRFIIVDTLKNDTTQSDKKGE